jgi:hypothetical protein
MDLYIEEAEVTYPTETFPDPELPNSFNTDPSSFRNTIDLADCFAAILIKLLVKAVSTMIRQGATELNSESGGDKDMDEAVDRVVQRLIAELRPIV